MLKTILTLCFVCSLFSVCFAQGASNTQEKVIFKANTEFSMQLENPVYSDKNNVGDDVNFVLTEDIVGDGDKIEKGSTIYGRIVKIEKISAKNDSTKVVVMFDFIKKGTDYIDLVATIISINPNPEDIKFAVSPAFAGGTTLSLKAKEIQLDKGRIFRAKLTQNITAK